MTVSISQFETQDILYVSFHADRLGDKFAIPKVVEEFVLLVGWGRARITEYRKPPWDTEAPALVLFSPGEIAVETLSDKIVMYCLFNKNSASLADVKAFVLANHGTVIAAPRDF